MVTIVCYACVESISSVEGKPKGNRRRQLRTRRRSETPDTSHQGKINKYISIN